MGYYGGERVTVAGCAVHYLQGQIGVPGVF